MKKFILSLLTGLIPFNFLFSNPIVIPKAIISELKFEADNKWLMEISFDHNQLYRKELFDSICISTLNGFSKIKLDNIADNTYLFVVTGDSLISPLPINIKGDYIRLYSFVKFYGLEIDSLTFGNYPGSTIDSIPEGYSISRISYSVFSKDKSPTIGFENDTTGTCGLVTGHVYDKENNLVTTGNFALEVTNPYENHILIQNDGSFSASIFSRKVTFSEVANNYREWIFEFVRIDSLKLNINPGILYNADIHFLNDYIVGIKDVGFEPEASITITNYPNPFNSTTNFIIKIPPDLIDKEKQINIFNINGKRIFSINFNDISWVKWDGKDFNSDIVSSGVYYYQLIVSKKVCKNGSMILLK